MACLKAIGGLTQLTWLELPGNLGLTQQGLLQLTGLSRLRALMVDRNGVDINDKVLQGFWPALLRL
jgi:hypothetical protein